MDKDEKLPDGFRFHPTDEELITCYLVHKVSDANFTGRAIGDVDLNKCEPWDLPGKAKMGEKEFYFFSMRDRKYPTGVRTNRATNTGYWKTTGKDKEIYESNSSELVGMKKTLVFYRGRAPRGEKTNWVMHEYRMHSKSSAFRNTKQDEWVVCRVFQKSTGGKKYPSNLQSSRAVGNPCVSLYNLDPPLQMNNMNVIHQQYPDMISNNFQLHANRNYMMMMTPAEFQELNKASSSSNNNNMINLHQQHPIPPQLNYGPAGSFTISGLNLNLGGAALQAQPLVGPGLVHDQHGGAGYGGDHSNSNRFMGMDECADLDNFWMGN